MKMKQVEYEPYTNAELYELLEIPTILIHRVLSAIVSPLTDIVKLSFCSVTGPEIGKALSLLNRRDPIVIASYRQIPNHQ